MALPMDIGSAYVDVLMKSEAFLQEGPTKTDALIRKWLSTLQNFVTFGTGTLSQIGELQYSHSHDNEGNVMMVT